MTQPPSESDQAEILGIQEYNDAHSFEPVWYDRSSGWEGRTYVEAASFCANNHAGGHGALCPYEAVCPTGPGSIPIGGVFQDYDANDATSVQWTPLADSYNDWVLVGYSDDVCRTFMNVHYESPAWGLTGENSEAITEALVCCRDMTASAESENDSVAAETSDGGGGGGTTASLSQAEIQELYNDAHSFEPVWYDRSSGWEGRTYDEASSFCTNNHAGGLGVLCPYEAVCPTGPSNVPSGGVFEDYDDANGMDDASLVQWTPLADSYNDWVMVGPNPDVCRTYMNVHYESPAWGLTGENSDDITQALICCSNATASAELANDSVTSVASDGLGGWTMPAALYQADESVSIEEASSNQIHLEFAPVAFNRNSGWMGQSYLDALIFCASKDSKILCPYEVVCSNLESELVDVEAGWVPIIDSPNGWARVGHSSGTCMRYNDLESHPPAWGLTGMQNEAITRTILCCDEPEGFGLEVDDEMPTAMVLNVIEEIILDTMHPVWFGRHEGYHGTTHEEAVLFCNTIGNMHLCPAEAYCPNGPRSDKPLFLQKDAFEGEEWAPLSRYNNEEDDISNFWIMVGTLNGDTSSTCHNYVDLNNGNSPQWTVDDNHAESKEHILCCLNPSFLASEENISRGLNSIWLDQSHGWIGGSYSEAQQFCQELGGKKLCPYTAYCPHGPGYNPQGGHSVDFNLEGEQWAPVYGDDNSWVLIGRKYQNSATTCMTHVDLEGTFPDWGLTGDNAGAKLHIQCCSV